VAAVEIDHQGTPGNPGKAMKNIHRDGSTQRRRPSDPFTDHCPRESRGTEATQHSLAPSGTTIMRVRTGPWCSHEAYLAPDGRRGWVDRDLVISPGAPWFTPGENLGDRRATTRVPREGEG
jgi:hypothetical protein